MRAGSESRMRIDGHSRTLAGPVLLLGGAVLLAGVAALVLDCVGAAIGDSSTSPGYGSGWSVATMVFMHADRIVYLPAVILGLVALGLAQSEATRGRAREMARLLLIPAVAAIIAGIGWAVCASRLGYENWSIISHVGRSVLKAGTLAGVAYLCLWPARSPGSAGEQGPASGPGPDR
jgi:hypothetical protein